MSVCKLGHRVVDSTGECVSILTLGPGQFLNINGPCETVALQLALGAREVRFRELLLEARGLLLAVGGLEARDLAEEIAEVLAA